MDDLPRKSRRPWGVTVLAIVIGLLSVVSLGRAVWYWTHVRYVWSLTGPVLTWVLLNASLPAALLCPPVAILLWRGKPIGRNLCLLLLGLGTLYYWFDKLIITVNPVGRVDWPLALMINVILICVVGFILLNRRAKGFFQEE